MQEAEALVFYRRSVDGRRSLAVEIYDEQFSGTWFFLDDTARGVNIGDHVLIRFHPDDQFATVILDQKALSNARKAMLIAGRDA